VKDGILNIGKNLASSCGQSLIIFGNAKLKVTFLPPVGTPGVSDFPVLRALILIVLGVLTISYQSHSMVNLNFICKRTTTVSFSDNSTSIAHKATRVGVHGKTCWSLGYDLLQSFNGNAIFFYLVIILDMLFVFSRSAR